MTRATDIHIQQTSKSSLHKRISVTRGPPQENAERKWFSLSVGLSPLAPETASWIGYKNPCQDDAKKRTRGFEWGGPPRTLKYATGRSSWARTINNRYRTGRQRSRNVLRPLRTATPMYKAASGAEKGLLERVHEDQFTEAGRQSICLSDFSELLR